MVNKEYARSTLADLLLRGPRGRRLLFQFALDSNTRPGQEMPHDSFSWACLWAAQHLEPGTGTWALPASLTPGSLVTPEETARRLSTVPLAEPTFERVQCALAEAVAAAAYWQEPDGTDALVSTAPMRAELRRVAEHLAVSEYVAWWSSPIALEEQWGVGWDGNELHSPPDAESVLRFERNAAHVVKGPCDDWWSYPSRRLATSTRAFSDGSLVGLWCVEDDLGWDEANGRRLHAPADSRVYEVDSAQAWAALCVRFPLDKVSTHRPYWDCVTGQSETWVMPDWVKVAEHYDGVHLQVATYLACAGTAIPVIGGTASVIAGWNPDETYWLTSNIRYSGPVEKWRRTEADESSLWVKEGAGH